MQIKAILRKAKVF